MQDEGAPLSPLRGQLPVHFLLVGGALQHLLRIGERGGEGIPTRLVISLVIALHLIDKRLQLGLVKGTVVDDFVLACR